MSKLIVILEENTYKMRKTKLFTVDGRVWYLAEPIEDLTPIDKKCVDFQIKCTQTNATGTIQFPITFQVQHIVAIKDIR